ncbi:hypothetical protein GCM10022224_042080 [Nonomuraea antimicrobica]|uniref:Transposase DDE domain-containing protein n=1 Tax=Nonomuraea antimicrobica TaxID=561173 RepID=A0ABP7BZU4_9ACTN
MTGAYMAAVAFPQLALGVVSTPRTNASEPNAVTTLKPLAAPGFPTAFAVVDRAYTDQQRNHFAAVLVDATVRRDGVGSFVPGRSLRLW